LSAESITTAAIKAASRIAKRMLDKSQCEISKHAVGAAVVASNGLGNRIFGGCNIELATKDCWHAEEVALMKAISEGYTYIKAVFVTSTSEEQRAALCGHCMEIFNRCNRDCHIYVLNPSGSMKLAISLKERNGPYAYNGSIHLKHK
jgi:cytidine deaminase